MLRWQGLAHAHPGAPPIHFEDVDVPQGAAVVLRGPSGSGKSTLLALLAGLLGRQQGTLAVAGTDPAALPRGQVDAWRGATVGLVPQRLHLSPSLSVRRNLALPYLSAGLPEDGARIDALLERLGLQGLGHRRPHELSVGQAQRVALARALLRRPKVLLADEPSSQLDDEAAAAALGLLAETATQEGATLVVATHDARVLATLTGARVLHLAASA